MKISIAILAAAAVSTNAASSPQRRRTQNIHNSAVAEEEYDVYLGLSKDEEKKNSVFGRELQDEGEEETGESEMPTCK